MIIGFRSQETLNLNGLDNGLSSILLDGETAETAAAKAAGKTVDSEGNLTAMSITPRKTGSTVGKFSTSEGLSTAASGEESHSEGLRSEALANAAHAEGNSCYARGACSHAEGEGTETKNRGEYAGGRFNLSHQASSAAYNAGNTAHSVGVGSNTFRKNAFEIMQDGRIFILGLGGYDGTNAGASGVSDLVTVLATLTNVSVPTNTFDILGNQ